MGNPFESVSVQNYNVDAPSDDASEVAGNQVEWSKHLGKIGNPLKTALESINTNNVTAHALHVGQTFETKNGNYQVAAPGDRGKTFSVTGTTTITLPAVADAGNGFPVIVKNAGSGTVTVDGSGAELIDGAASITLAANEWALLNTNGATWSAKISRLVVQLSGSFTGTLTGMDAATTGTVKYSINGNLCTLYIEALIQGTSDANTMQMTGLPAAVLPAADRFVPTIVRDNTSTGNFGSALIDTSGALIAFRIGDPLSLTGFTAIGTKGLQVGWAITYPLT